MSSNIDEARGTTTIQPSWTCEEMKLSTYFPGDRAGVSSVERHRVLLVAQHLWKTRYIPGYFVEAVYICLGMVEEPCVFHVGFARCHWDFLKREHIRGRIDLYSVFRQLFSLRRLNVFSHKHVDADLDGREKVISKACFFVLPFDPWKALEVVDSYMALGQNHEYSMFNTQCELFEKTTRTFTTRVCPGSWGDDPWQGFLFSVSSWKTHLQKEPFSRVNNNLLKNPMNFP